MRVRIALAAGLACVAVGIGITLSGSPLTVTATNAVAIVKELATTETSASACQRHEALPRGTSAIRISLGALIGPRIVVRVIAGGRVVAAGEHGSGWTGGSVTVPLRPRAAAVPDTEVCFAFSLAREAVRLVGAPSAPAQAALSGGQVLPGRMRIEYLRPGLRSWWSLARTVARHLGLGKAPGGSWTALLVAALMAVVAGLSAWLVRRDLGAAEPQSRGLDVAADSRLGRALGRVPSTAWVCALVACLNAAAWSLLTPPFQVPDEPDHFAYVQQLVQARALPLQHAAKYSPEERVALRDLHQPLVRLRPQFHTIASLAQQRRLLRDLARDPARRGPGGVGVAHSEPPLYYALAAVPYLLGGGGTILERLELMRLLSAVLAGVTALFAFMFVREVLPGQRWAWTVGGLGVALAPLLGFISGGVTPEALLYAVAAALFYCLARAFRRGFSTRLAVAIGCTVAVGLATKLNFAGLVPGVVVGSLVLAWRARGAAGYSGGVYRRLAVLWALGASPVVAYVAFNVLSGRSALGLVAGALSVGGRHGSLPGEVGYIWQYYLPRLPGMGNDFPDVSTTRQVWFDWSVGLYGWLDTVFPEWVDRVALIPASAVAILCFGGLVAGRRALRRRVGELGTYLAMGAGLAVLVGAASYQLYPVIGGEFSEPRYLLALLAPLGVVLALAARGAGRRWGPAAGALIVVLVLAHDVFSQLQVVARYYV